MHINDSWALNEGQYTKGKNITKLVSVGVSFAVASILLTSCFMPSSKADTLGSSQEMGVSVAEASRKVSKNTKTSPTTPKSKASIPLKMDLASAETIQGALSGTDSLFFTSALDKSASGTYAHVWGKEDMRFIDSNDLEIFYPKGSYSPGNSPIVGWAGFIYLLGKKLDTATLSYRVKFDDNFNFVKGGKLPGLCSGNCPRGGAEVGDDFSTRFMWRTNGDLEVYAYIPNKQETYGKSFGRGSFRFVAGKYYKIGQKITLNTPGKSDGEIVMYVDDAEVFRDSAVTFRETSETHIDSILFSTFFWGNDATWATPVDTHTHFKDFTLTY